MECMSGGEQEGRSHFTIRVEMDAGKVLKNTQKEQQLAEHLLRRSLVARGKEKTIYFQVVRLSDLVGVNEKEGE